MTLFDRIVDQSLLIRRINVVANHVLPESSVRAKREPEQIDLFADYAALEAQQKGEQEALEKDKKIQKTVISIKQNRSLENVILKGMNLEKGATT